MARAGQVIESPITGDTLIFHRTAQNTDGALLCFEEVKAVTFKGPPPHIHPHQEERFEVLEGTARLSVNGREQVLHEGESITIPPYTSHSWGNGGDTPVRVITEFRPALHIEHFFESLYLLPYLKRSRNLARPGLLQMALLSLEYESFLPRIPIAVQKIIFLSLKPFALLAGYRARYTEADISSPTGEMQL